MKIIVVAGQGSGLGKTTLAAGLLEMFKGFDALKVTTVHNKSCPHKRFCGTCEDLDTPYKIIKQREIINTPEKDTYRLKQAGAKRVVWLVSKFEVLSLALKKAIALLEKGSEGIIIEGTSVLKHIKPDLSFYIKR